MKQDIILAVERLPDGYYQVRLNAKAFSDPLTWAVIIAALTTNIAHAIAQGSVNRAVLDTNLRAAVRREWDNPTEKSLPAKSAVEE